MARRAFFIPGACAALLCATVAAVRLFRRTFLAVEVSGNSMSPTLEPGDFVLVRRRAPLHEITGRIAYLRGPDGRPLLKRVVGAPGESLRVGRHVEVNGRPLIEPYAAGETPPPQYRGVHRLPAGEYFVLGDNRSASTDSRDFGPAHAADIEGVATFRYWPRARFGRLDRPARTFGTPAAPGIPVEDGARGHTAAESPLRDAHQFGTTS